MVGQYQQREAKHPDQPKITTTCEYELIDVAGNSAMVKLQVYKDSQHFAADYMLLYKFTDGWKIVSKIFKMR